MTSQTMRELQELNAIMNASQIRSNAKNSHRGAESHYYDYEDDENDDKKFGGHTQWTSVDGIKFFPAGITREKLTPGLWEPRYSPSNGFYMEKLVCKTTGLLQFPETNSKKVVEEIQNFWGKEELFRSYNLAYKRGIILWGPPGSGKSSTVKLVLKDVIERGGIAMKIGEPSIFIECIRIFRSVQPETPVVVLLEDIDSIISTWGETEILNILDGVENVDKVIFLATTNYPEELGERIINRPSRFDRRFKMPHPGKASRRLYFQHLLEQSNIDKIDIDVWVKDTQGMSIAHLKELFIAVCILGDSYDEVVAVLRSMTEDKISSSEDRNINMGFGKIGTEEED